MRLEAREAIRRVLREASDHDKFCGMTFAERLNWMIGRGFELGRREEGMRSEHVELAKADESGKCQLAVDRAQCP